MRMEKIIYYVGDALHSWLATIALIITLALNFIAPVSDNLIVVCVLIIVDIVTALIALFMDKKRTSATLLCAIKSWYIGMTSKRAADSIPKLVYYFMLVILAYFIGKLFGQPDTYPKVATGLICFTEIRSIIENGDKAFNTNMIEFVEKYAKSTIEKLLPNKKGE